MSFSKPKKSFGQNFLIEESVSDRIVESFINSNTTPHILEVGPGRAALTKLLLNYRGFDFKAVEVDRDMIIHLLSNYPLEGNLITQDFLKLDLAKVFDGKEYGVIGNFPYNISSQILFHIEKYKEYIPIVVGMFQKEVAERLAAKEGTKKYGITSVLIGAFYECKILFDVNPSSFYPRPKVTSSVVKLVRKQDFELPCDKKLFKAVVKQSFNQRRKMLRNSLKSLIKNLNVSETEYMTRRPEQMSLEDYYKLTLLIQNAQI